MTIRPGDQVPGAQGGMRASDADRERMIDVLKAAFARGQLTEAELDERTGQALGSRTYGELAAIWASIPPGRAEAQGGTQPAVAPARKPVRGSMVAWGACAIIAPAVVAAFLTYIGGFLVLLVLVFIGTVLTGDGAQRRW